MSYSNIDSTEKEFQQDVELARAKRIENAIKTLSTNDTDFIATLEYVALLSKKNPSLYATARGMLKKEALKLLKK